MASTNRIAAKRRPAQQSPGPTHAAVGLGLNATDIALRTRTVDWLAVPGLGGSRPVELPGREKSISNLQGSADNLLTVKKTYEAARS